jgi:hypothetical protein
MHVALDCPCCGPLTNMLTRYVSPFSSPAFVEFHDTTMVEVGFAA